MYINKYPNGEIHIIGKNVGIQLFPDRRIFYGYFDEDIDYLFRFDSLSEVGEIWKKEVENLIKKFEIELGKMEDSKLYCDCWIKHNITPYDNKLFPH